MHKKILLRVVTVAACSMLALVLIGPGSAQTAQQQTWQRPTGVEDFGYRLHRHRERPRPASDLTGSDALGAVQEVVGLLLSDSRTDWQQVSIQRLRQHLVDLDRLVVRAAVEEREIDGGVVAVVGGDDESVAAARRVVLRHAERMNGFRGWRVAARDLDDRIEVSITTADASELPVLRAIGFYGFLASGVHRPHELLAVARGRD